VVFDQAESLGLRLSLLDIGGGFPSPDGGSLHPQISLTFEEIASTINTKVDHYFPKTKYPDVRIIAEPGRYFVTSAFTLASRIEARRHFVSSESQANKQVMYYVGDGVYGAFNCIAFDHAVPSPSPLKIKDRFIFSDAVKEQKLVPHMTSSVWGPTCDSMDCISKECRLPLLEIGDWLRFDNMGAYTMVAASNFNGFKQSQVYYVNE